MSTVLANTALIGTGTWQGTRLPAAAQPRLRITRRGRTVLAVLIAVPLAIAAVVGGVGAMGATATDAPVTSSFQYVHVAAGESLWQVAQEIAPKADPRDVVADLTRLNGLEGATLQPGQRLAIPAKYAH
jgi:ABC-type transport system involved in cytochrome c biogenesis permease component